MDDMEWELYKRTQVLKGEMGALQVRVKELENNFIEALEVLKGVMPQANPEWTHVGRRSSEPPYWRALDFLARHTKRKAETK